MLMLIMRIYHRIDAHCISVKKAGSMRSQRGHQHHRDDGEPQKGIDVAHAIACTACLPRTDDQKQGLPEAHMVAKQKRWKGAKNGPHPRGFVQDVFVVPCVHEHLVRV